jgi:SAM-dependent methyltransferase
MPAGDGTLTVGASAWVRRWLRQAPPPRAGSPSTLLDFACGSGRHALLASQLGYSVLAVDRDPSGLAELERRGIHVLQEDLEHRQWSFAARRFDVVVCTNYLYRPRLDLLCSLIAAGGMLVYETFSTGNARYGRPSNPDFLLRHGELAATALRAGLQLLAYEDGYSATPRAAMVQRAVATRPPSDPESRPLD